MASSILRRLLSQPQAAAALAAQACGSGSSARPFQLVQLAAFSASAAAAMAGPASGKLFGACVLERLPVVVPEDPDWELEYRAWQATIRERYMKVLPKEYTDLKDSEMQVAEAGSRYEPAPRITEADTSNDTQSLKRRLDQRLFMLVRPRGSSGNGSKAAAAAAGAVWSLPQTENQGGESMRQTAERALAEAVDTSAVQPYFVGNAPAGHVELAEAGTLFFHRCQLIQGTPALQAGSGYGEHVWVAKDELPEYIQQPELLSLLQQML